MNFEKNGMDLNKMAGSKKFQPPLDFPSARRQRFFHPIFKHNDLFTPATGFTSTPRAKLTMAEEGSAVCTLPDLVRGAASIQRL
jgi:hypothetical protein